MIIKEVRAYPVTIDELLSGNMQATQFHYVKPVSATILSAQGGTLLKDASGNLFLAQMGEWFRNGVYHLPQIEEFDQLSGLGLTELKKDKVTLSKKNEETGEIDKKEVEVLSVKEKKKKKDA